MRANFYATGHWRCRVFASAPGDAIDVERDPVLFYTNGREWDIFGDERLSWTDATIAEALAKLFAPSPYARRADPAYAEWFLDLVRRTGSGVFASYDEYADWEAEGSIAVFLDGGRTVELMPLPPRP